MTKTRADIQRMYAIKARIRWHYKDVTGARSARDSVLQDYCYQHYTTDLKLRDLCTMLFELGGFRRLETQLREAGLLNEA